MKRVLTLAALVTLLSVPALAEEAATTAPAPAASANQPAAVQILPTALPQSTPPQDAAMSKPEDAADNGMSAGGGGCHHAKTTVYLTN